MRAQIGAISWPNRACDCVLNVLLLELALKQAENAVGCDEPADPCHRADFADALEQPTGEALLARTQQVYYVAAEFEKVRQSGAVPRHASSTEENNIAGITRDQQIIWNRGTVGEEAHPLILSRSPRFSSRYVIANIGQRRRGGAGSALTTLRVYREGSGENQVK
jgi:hypothetical protein